MLKDINWVLARLEWMRAQRIWPWGTNVRYLWTDGFGVVLGASLFRETRQPAFLQLADDVIEDVYRVLGRPRGIRIGAEEDRFGQYAHYNAVWIFALTAMYAVTHEARYAERALKLVEETHGAFVTPQGVWWKMEEDLSGPLEHGYGGLDHFKLFVAYKLLARCLPNGEARLAREIGDVRRLVDRAVGTFRCDQDLGLGMMLWCASFFPAEPWAVTLRQRCLASLRAMWVPAGSGQGYFARASYARSTALAFSNYGASVGLQAAGELEAQCAGLNAFFEAHPSGDEYDTKAITWVMACCSHFPGLFMPSEWDAAFRGGPVQASSIPAGLSSSQARADAGKEERREADAGQPRQLT